MSAQPRRYALVLAALALLLTPTASAEDAPETGLARLSIGNGWDALPAVVAIERGFFAQQALVVSPQISESLQTLANSLQANSTDYAVVSQRDFLKLAEADLPAIAVALNSWGSDPELILPGDSESESLASLRGKRIAVGGGSDALPLLVRLLDQEEIPLADVSLQVISHQSIPKVFADDTADALFEAPHFTRPLLESGARVLVSQKAIAERLGNRGATALLVRRNLAEKEPERVQRFVNAWVRGLRYIEQDKDDSARLLQAFFHRQGVKVSRDLALSWIDYSRYDRVAWNDEDIADAEYNAWALVEVGILKSIPTLAPFVDKHFAERSAADLTKSAMRPEGPERSE